MMNLIERVMGMQIKTAVFVDVDGVLNSDEFAKHCLEEEGYDIEECECPEEEIETFLDKREEPLLFDKNGNFINLRKE